MSVSLMNLAVNLDKRHSKLLLSLSVIFQVSNSTLSAQKSIRKKTIRNNVIHVSQANDSLYGMYTFVYYSAI